MSVVVVHVCCVRRVSYLGQSLLRNRTQISVLLYEIGQGYGVERQARQIRNVPICDSPGVQLLVSTPTCRQSIARPPCRARTAEPDDLGLNDERPLDLRHGCHDGYETAIFARRVPSQRGNPMVLWAALSQAHAGRVGHAGGTCGPMQGSVTSFNTPLVPPLRQVT